MKIRRLLLSGLLLAPLCALGQNITRVTPDTAIFQSNTSSGVPRTITCPTSAINDLQIVLLEADGGSMPATPAGWTLKLPASGSQTYQLAWARFFPSGGSATVTFNYSSNTSIQGVCRSYRNVETAGGVDGAFEDIKAISVSSSTVIRVPAMTIVNAGDALIYFGSSRNQWSTVTSGANFTHQIDDVIGGNAMTVDDWIQTTASNIPQQDLTVTGSGGVATNVGYLYALKRIAPTGPTITSVSGDDVLTATEAGLHVLGSGFGASAGTIQCVDGAVTATWTATNWTATDVTVTAVQGHCRFGSTTLRLTTSTAQVTTRPIVMNPIAGHSYVNLTGQPTLAWGGYVSLVPNRITYRGWAADPAADVCGTAAQAEEWVSGGTGSITPVANGTINAIAATVTQISFRCHSGTAWSPIVMWDIGGI